MLSPDELLELTRRLRRAPLLAAEQGIPVQIDRDALERLVPHRPPMLLVDAIEAIDLEHLTARGRRTLAPSDRGFDGHFPDAPVYPGAFVLEAIGQLALTILHFHEAGSLTMPDRPSSRRVLPTHIHHATFLRPFRPGDTMTLHGALADSGLTLIACGQAYCGGALAAFMVAEFYVDG